MHRQHGFTINHTRLCVRQARLIRTRNEALPPEALKAMSNDPSGVFIAFNPDVGMRLSGKGQAGGQAETRAKFDYIIVGLNVQAFEHTPGKFETAGSKYALAEPQKQPMSRHLGSIQMISWQAGNRCHSFCFNWVRGESTGSIKTCIFNTCISGPRKSKI
jgi:hypothetical protein